MFLSKFRVDISRLNSMFDKKISLSTYFPAGTQFYYGYPIGEDSGFLNHASPATQELIAARAFGCSGKDVSIICYSATTSPCISPDVFQDLSIPFLSEEQTLVLPAGVDMLSDGKARNLAIKAALKGNVTPGSLIMAQPYIDKDMSSLYSLSPHLTVWLNDKSNMGEYIPERLMPKRQGSFTTGAEFAKKIETFMLPVVVKVSSSSSGDGVYICLNEQELSVAADALRGFNGNVLVEQYINTTKNYGVHFGVPHSKKMPIDLIGINEQLTTAQGKFVGGIIRSTEIPPNLKEAVEYLRSTILPKVRKMGWYGIGGFDILIDEIGRPYYIDCNFRMTGMSAYHFMVANGEVTVPLVSINGEFNGTYKELEDKLYPYSSVNSPEKFLQIIALSRHEDKWQFNATISFQCGKQLKERANKLLRAGVISYALDLLV